MFEPRTRFQQIVAGHLRGVKGRLFLAAGSVVVANIIYESFVGGHFTSSAAMLVVLIAFNLAFVVAGRKWIARGMRH